MISHTIIKSNLYQTILAALIWFDLFDYPLTAGEVLKYGMWQGDERSLSGVDAALRNGVSAGLFGYRDGFYCIPGREKAVFTRAKRYNYANRKFLRALRIAKLFRLVPWIKLVAFGNIIGTNNLKDGSDIDLFIVTEKKRVWLGRLICTGCMKLLRLRPREGDERDKICLSFYVSEDKLDLYDLMLKTKEIQHDIPDIYFIYWLACLVPVYDRDNTYGKLVEANGWLREVLPEWRPTEPVSRRHVRGIGRGLYGKLCDLVFGWLEGPVKRVQMKIFPDSILDRINKDTRVVVCDDIIKLHVRDRRREYHRKFIERYRAFER